MQAELKTLEEAKKISETNKAALLLETDYTDWRGRIAEKREDMYPFLSPRGSYI
jgi:hypothetical protein